MKNKSKNMYLPPTISVVICKLEQGIAAASGQFNGGDVNNPDLPQMEGWTGSGLGVGYGDAGGTADVSL